MKLVTSTYEIAKMVGEKEALRIAAAAGFDGVDFALDTMNKDDSPWNAPDAEARAQEMREYAESLGICIAQTHAPFSFPWADEEAYQNIALPRMAHAIELSGIMGAELCVVHPLHYLNYKTYKDLICRRTIEMYRYLLPYAKKANVKIALENVFQSDSNGKLVTDMYEDYNEVLAAFAELNDPQFCFCLDTAHSLLTGHPSGEIIRALGTRYLHTLHLSDNDGIRDRHNLPYHGIQDWDDVTTALHDIGYDGLVDLELIGFYRSFPSDLVESATRFSCEVGRRILREIKK